MTAARAALVSLGELEQLAELALSQGGAIAEIGSRLMFGLARYRSGQRLGLTVEVAFGWSPGPATQRKARQVALLREAALLLDGSARRRAQEICKGVAAAARHGPRPRANATALENLYGELVELGLMLPCAERVRKIIAGSTGRFQ